MIIKIAKSLYPKTVVLKAAYNFTDRAYIYIQQSDNEYIIDINHKSDEDKICEEEFKNELLSQTVRHEIYLQTSEVRKLITMRALASTIVGEENDILPSPDNVTEENILKDWFEDENKEL